MARNRDPQATEAFHRQMAWHAYYQAQAARARGDHGAVVRLERQMAQHTTAGKAMEAERVRAQAHFLSFGGRGHVAKPGGAVQAAPQGLHVRRVGPPAAPAKPAPAPAPQVEAVARRGAPKERPRRGAPPPAATPETPAHASKPERKGAKVDRNSREHQQAHHAALAERAAWAAKHHAEKGDHVQAARHNARAREHKARAGSDHPPIQRGKHGGTYYVSKTGAKVYL